MNGSDERPTILRTFFAALERVKEHISLIVGPTSHMPVATRSTMYEDTEPAHSASPKSHGSERGDRCGRVGNGKI